MPMQANGPMTVGIRPADRPQQTGKSGSVERRDSGSSSAGFSPRTDVAIKTAVDDMAGILSKISANSEEPVDAMPKELQQVIDNVLKQAFSYSETLGRGLGSTMESQRFSMDQLESLARMLFQLSSLAEKGYTVDIPDSLSTLLQNLKGSIGQETDQQLEPVILAKVAFALLDNAPEDMLPKEVQTLLAALSQQGQGSAIPQQTGTGETLGFLKKLVDFLMPRPASTEAASQGAGSGQSAPGGNTAQTQQSAQGGTAAQTAQQTVARAGTPQMAGARGQQPGTTTPQGTASPQAAAAQPGTTGSSQATAQGTAQGQPAASPGNGQASSTASGQQTGEAAKAPQESAVLQQGGAKAAPQPAGTTGAQQQAASQTAQGGEAKGAGQPASSAQPGGNPAETVAKGAATNTAPQNAAPQNSQPGPLTTAMQQAKMAMMNEPMENSPQLMDSLKQLAQTLVKDKAVTGEAMQLLQNFVNGKETVLSEKDARQLQLLIRVCQQNVPATVQQAAIQQNLPDLPRLWAFMQLCDMTATRKMSADQLKKAGKDVAVFIQSMRGSMGGDNMTADGARSMNFMLPIFFGGVDKYPAYIHVYDENTRDRYTGELRKETWLRICMLTESIGAVELTSRVFNGDQLDMRVFFFDKDAADAFREDLQNVRKSLRGSKLKLHDFEVNASGERRFL